MSKEYIDFDAINQLINPIDLLSLIAYEKSKPELHGKELKDFCPIHGGDNQHSLSIDTVKKKFYCHNGSCNARGDMIELYAKSKNKTIHEAAKELASFFNIDEVKMPERSPTTTFTPAQKPISEKNNFLEDLWNRAMDEGSHPYFLSKDVKPCRGIRYGNSEYNIYSILVPFRNICGHITAIEYINEEKGYASSSKRSASFFVIDDKDHTIAKKAYLAEGLATALTINESIGAETDTVVISCGAADNLPKVARVLREKYPHLNIIACPDDDGAGKKSAEGCKNIHDVHIIRPNFTGIDKSEKENDFNDLKKLTNIETVRKQLMEYTPSTIEKSHDSHAIHPKNIIEKIKERMLSHKSGKPTLPGISTGYTKLDEIIGGFQNGHLITIGARSGHGKSWLALNFLKNIAIVQSIPSLLISLEMSYEQIEYRLLMLLTGIPCKKMKDGSLSEGEFLLLEQAYNTIKTSKLSIDEDTANSNLDTLSCHIDKARKDGIKFIVIDHVGLIHVSKGYSENRVIEMGTISRDIKKLAKSREIPILICAQLNREADSPEKPKGSQLRESDTLKQDSDILILLQRPEKYGDTRQGEIDTHIDKNRDGEETSITFRYDKSSWQMSEKDTVEKASKTQPEEETADLSNQSKDIIWLKDIIKKKPPRK
jgi:replicative DNA helicase